MSGFNVPDDWGTYYSRCGYCRTSYHASEGGCGPCGERLDELSDEADQALAELTAEMQARPRVPATRVRTLAERLLAALAEAEEIERA